MEFGYLSVVYAHSLDRPTAFTAELLLHFKNYYFQDVSGIIQSLGWTTGKFPVQTRFHEFTEVSVFMNSMTVA
jgi:hypothetical protein